jgi:hypothetical protein
MMLVPNRNTVLRISDGKSSNRDVAAGTGADETDDMFGVGKEVEPLLRW